MKGKEERSPWGTKGQEGKGHLGMWRHLLELSRCQCQRASSGTLETTAFNLLKGSSLPLTVDRQVTAVDRRKSRLSTDEGLKIQESLCLQLLTAIRDGGRPSEAIG